MKPVARSLPVIKHISAVALLTLLAACSSGSSDPDGSGQLVSGQPQLISKVDSGADGESSGDSNSEGSDTARAADDSGDGSTAAVAPATSAAPELSDEMKSQPLKDLEGQIAKADKDYQNELASIADDERGLVGKRTDYYHSHLKELPQELQIPKRDTTRLNGKEYQRFIVDPLKEKQEAWISEHAKLDSNSDSAIAKRRADALTKYQAHLQKLSTTGKDRALAALDEQKKRDSSKIDSTIEGTRKAKIRSDYNDMDSSGAQLRAAMDQLREIRDRARVSGDGDSADAIDSRVKGLGLDLDAALADKIPASLTSSKAISDKSVEVKQVIDDVAHAPINKVYEPKQEAIVKRTGDLLEFAQALKPVDQSAGNEKQKTATVKVVADAKVEHSDLVKTPVVEIQVGTPTSDTNGN